MSAQNLVQQLEDATRQQRIAADPRRSVFVIANAGSGKTKVLVDRIARLLLTDAPPNRFLCITYTKAAAAEMQRRLFERLGAWCVADDVTLTRELQTLLGIKTVPPDEQLAKARALFARALETPGGLKIQTIHAFCERLLARFPLEAGVAPGFSIIDDAQKALLMEAAWARVCADPDPELQASLTHQAALLDFDTLQGRIGALVARNDVLSALPGDRDERAAILRARHGAHATGAAQAQTESARMDWAALDWAVELLERGGKSEVKTALSMRKALQTRDFSDLQGVFLTDKHEPRSKLVTKPTAAKSPSLETTLLRLQGDVVAARERVQAALNADDVIAACDVAAALNAAFVQAKENAGAVDFDDLIAMASRLLHQAEAAPWVLFKLDGGLDHILIDESQDTSPLQWSLIEPLRQEFLAGHGQRDLVRTIFAVGDPKQSIYSFQGADPARFQEEARAVSLLSGGVEPINPILQMSFRSTPEVLQIVDETFASEAIAAEPPEEFNLMAHVAARGGEQGCVEWWPIAPKSSGAGEDPWQAPSASAAVETPIGRLAHAIAAHVKEGVESNDGVWRKGALSPMRAGDVLILVRKRGQVFEQILRALKHAGLPVAGADRMTLSNELAVQDLLGLIRVAIDPRDDLALACLLKSPWLGLIDDEGDLAPLAFGRRPGESLFDRLQNADARFAPVRAFIDDLAAHASLAPFAFISRYLEQIDASGRSGWERIFARLGPESRDPIEETLARALGGSRGRPASLIHFLSAFEADDHQIKRELEESHDRVRVMTVHGSKGLESPIVILPDTTSGNEGRIRDGAVFYAGAPILVKAKDEDDAVTRRAREGYLAAQARESLRLLYVAMTRARDRLIVCGAHHGSGQSGRAEGAWHALTELALKKLGRPCETPFGEGYRYGVRLKAQSQSAAKELVGDVPPWSRRAAPMSPRTQAAQSPSHLRGGDTGLSPRRSNQARLQRGALIHGLLQRLPDIDPPLRAKASQAWLDKQNVPVAAQAALTEEALAVLTHPDFATVFQPGGRAEAPFLARLENGLVLKGQIDRLLVLPDRVLCIDYKTDRPAPRQAQDTPERILLQMAGYRAALAVIFPGRAVSCALVWTDGPHLVTLPDALLDTAWAQRAMG
jgi:ATP-dependent helicase/nuclease subunit A